MIIFITIPWFDPAFKAGGPVQSIKNLVTEFREDVEYRIFCGNTDLNETPLVDIETGKWIDYNHYTKVWYATTNRRSETLLEQVKMTRPDCLFIVGIFSWHFNIVPMLFCKVPLKIVSVRGMLHPGALTQKSLKKKLYINAWRMTGLQDKVRFHATDLQEAAFIKAAFGEQVVIDIAANFPKRFAAFPAKAKQEGQLDMISIALISPMKNHLLVLEALAEIEEAISYHIYGPVKDIAYWQHCSEQIEKLPPNITVRYHGEVNPSAIGDLLSDAHLFILPSKSENFGHAIYEALSAGRPVVTSHNTPWQSLAENYAGQNTDTTIAAVRAAIEHFAGLNQFEYDRYVKGSAIYAADKIDEAEIREQYRRMFFETAANPNS
ncbi:MAG: glycosyltransferase family 4 protein [Ferruginibacter sp.]|nr:glycosyltransferase family 4 protein [Ferruginibacter sp.]